MAKKKQPRAGTERPSSQREERPAEVRLTKPAFQDLLHLSKRHHEVVRWAATKMLLLARNPYAGVPLGDQLVGFRKIVVGNRDWRIVWRVEVLDNGDTVIDIGEIWAIGARSDDEVYDEMVRRVKSLDVTRPESVSLAEVVVALARGRQESEIAEPAEPVPAWLRERLVKTAKIESSIVATMTLQQAVDAWTDYISRASD